MEGEEELMEAAEAAATVAVGMKAEEEVEAEEEEVGEGSEVEVEVTVERRVHSVIETRLQWPRLQIQTPESQQNELIITSP